MVETYVLTNERVRRFALAAVVRAPIGMQVRISQETRSLDDNAALHATLTEIAKQLPNPRTGEFHSTEYWKRLLTLMWLKELKQMPEVIADVDGETYGILIPHTSDLTSPQCKALNLYCQAFGAERGVVFKEPKSKEAP